jgi:outer membrane protein assembly factor BamB
VKTFLTLSVLFFLVTFTSAQTPEFQWAKRAGGASDDRAYRIVVDASGNSFVTGYFASSTITFGTTTLTNAGYDDMYLVKYDTSGNVVWVKSAGGTSKDRGYWVAADAAGNCFVVGIFSSPTITFGSTTLINGSETSMFLAKYDANGNVIWAKSTNGIFYDPDDCGAVGLDSLGNIYVTGSYSNSTITFGTTTLINAGNTDIYVVKYDTSGNVVWAKSAGGTNKDISMSIALDSDGNSYVTGNFTSPTLSFGPTTLINTGERDFYIVKYSANGDVLWARSASGNAWDNGRSIAVGPSKEILVTGEFQSPTLTLGTTTLTNTNSSALDVFVVKFDSGGQVLWATNPHCAGQDYPGSITTDASGNSYVAGCFYYQDITFRSITLPSHGNSDIFIVKYDKNGLAVWAKTALSTDYNYAYGIVLDLNRNIYLTGFFSSPAITFGATTLNSAGNYDMYIAKINQNKDTILPPTLESPSTGSLNQSTSLTLKWHPSIYATSYKLQVGTDSSFSAGMVVDDSTVIDTFKIVNSLNFNTTYLWRVSTKRDSVSTDYSEIWNFKTAPNQLSVGLVASYPFNGNANDESGNGHNGIVNGATLATDRFGEVNKAYTFDGIDDYIQVPHNEALNLTGDFTVSVWFKSVAPTNSYHTIITKRDDSLGDAIFPWQLSISYYPGLGNPEYKKAMFGIRNDFGQSDFQFSTDTVNQNQWEHILVVVRSDTSFIYMDDSLQSISTIIIPRPINIYPVNIGWNRRQSYEQMFGSIDDVRLYKRALSFLEIDSLYHEGGWVSPPRAASLRDTVIYDAGRVPTVTLNYSAAGSSDNGGTIDSIWWYVNGIRVGNDTTLSYGFPQGTNTLKLVVRNNLGAKDSSSARVTIIAHTLSVNGPVRSGLSLLGDNVLYVVATGDAIYRLDNNLNLQFDLQVNGDILSASSIAFDTTMYIGSTDRNLYAFSNHGAPVWSPIPLGGVLSSTPSIDSLNNCIYIGVQNRNFFAINRKTGQVAWSFFTDAPIEHSAVITRDKKLVFSTKKGTIYGFDHPNPLNSPQPDWIYSLGDSITCSPAIDRDGNVYFGTKTGKLVKVSLKKGQQISIMWETQTGSAIYASPVIDGNGIVYVGSTDSTFYSINVINGDILWSRKTGNPIYSTPAISEIGTIYFANDAGDLFALDSLGTLKWRYQHTSAIRSPILCSKGAVYFGTEDSLVMAIYDGETSSYFAHGISTNSSQIPVWGTFQGNNRRTGSADDNGIPTIFNLANINVDVGWNMVSLPLTIVDAVKQDLYPSAISSIYAFEGTYVSKDILENGVGYWLKFAASDIVTFLGELCTVDTIDVHTGWNMIGSISSPVTVSSITSIPGGIITTNFFRYKTSYQSVDTIYPGSGYWVKVNQDGKLVLSASTVLSQGDRIQIVPTSELPPSAPVENLDVQTLPKEYTLGQAYPNPFNPTTIISYTLPKPEHVRLTIYNMLGQEVSLLIDSMQEAGYKSVEFNASGLPSGVYSYRLDAGTFTGVKKLLLLK